MSWGSQYYPPSTQLVIFHLPIAHPAGNVHPWAFANLDLNKRGKVVTLLAGSEYQIHVYNWDSKLLLKLLILENRQFLPSGKRDRKQQCECISIMLSLKCSYHPDISGDICLCSTNICHCKPLTLCWVIEKKKKNILSSATPCLQEKSFNFSTFSLECYLETFSS